MGLHDGVVRWVRNWLSGRRQRVAIQGVASGTKAGAEWRSSGLGFGTSAFQLY